MKNIFTLLILLIIVSGTKAQVWQQLISPTEKNIESSSFINDNEGWIGIQNDPTNAQLFHTADGGTDWDTLTIPGAAGGITNIDFPNQTTGYAVVNGQAFKTPDAGISWDLLVLPSTPTGTPYFLNKDTGFISSTDTIYKTLDGGLTWDTIALNFFGTVFTRYQFLNDSTGAAIDLNNYVWGTTNGGLTWNIIDDGGLWSYSYSAWYNPNGSLFYCGYTDIFSDVTVHIIGGPNYFESADFNRLYDIRFTDTLKGFAAGSDGYVVSTVNGGLSWSELNLDALFNLTNTSLYRVDGFNDVYAFGSNGRAFKRPAYCSSVALFNYTVTNLSVTFSNQSLNATSWHWHFGDGGASTTQNPTHNYSAEGIYDACLITNTPGCAIDTLCQTISVCGPNTSLAIEGTLDATFDNDGIVQTDFGSLNDVCHSIAIQADHKIIAGGRGIGSGLVRYNTDGSLDNTFDGDGKLPLSLSPYNLVGNLVTMHLAPDAKIVVAGDIGSNDSIFVIRYNPDGSRDSTFGGDGLVITDLANNDDEYVIDLTIQSDGKILVAAYHFTIGVEPLVARYNTDGSLDTSFAGDGIAHLEDINDVIGLADIKLQSDGKILIAGSKNDSDEEFSLIRMNADGSIDSTFDGDGVVFTNVNPGSGANNDFAVSVMEQPDGKIIAAGQGQLNVSGLTDAFAVLRYNSDGSLDSSFGNNGIAMLQIDSLASITEDAILQPDGKILIAGYAWNNSVKNKIGMARLLSNGTIDSTFGNYGTITTGVNCDDTYGYAIALDENKIYAGGQTGSYPGDFCVARYIADISTGSGFQDRSATFNLSSFPNPFSQSTTIQFSLQKYSSVKIELLDLAGRKIETIANGHFDSGLHQLSLQKENLDPGLYFIQLKTEGTSESAKLIIQ